MRGKPLLGRPLCFSALSLAVGLLLISILRTFESPFEELLAAAVFGGLAFVPTGKSHRIVLGAFVAATGWLAGLAVSNANGLSIGLGVGTWTMMSLALFSFVGAGFMRRGRILRGVLITLLGLAIGLGVEILQILPSFVHLLRFQDSQALGILAAAVLIPPALALMGGGGTAREAGR